ncbi:MAG: hypothetical protein AAF235_02235 [Planctomycetota bacterium]
MQYPIATIRQIRRVVIVFVAVATTLLAITLVVHALSPKGLGLAQTSQLLGILALLTLPACTIAAWAWDRAVRKRTAALADSAEHADMSSEPIDADEPECTTLRTREHPAGRTRPHETPAASSDFELPDDLSRQLDAAAG